VKPVIGVGWVRRAAETGARPLGGVMFAYLHTRERARE